MYIVIEVCYWREIHQRMLFISEGKKGRGELEEPSPVGALFCCLQAEPIEPKQAYVFRQDAGAGASWPCLIRCIAIPSGLSVPQDKTNQKKPPSFHVELFEFIVPSRITSAASVGSSLRIETLMNRWNFGWLLTGPTIRALYTWHFSSFNLHVLLLALAHCGAKKLLVPAACKWYISPNSSVIKHSDLNFKKSFRTCVQRNCCWNAQTA